MNVFNSVIRIFTFAAIVAPVCAVSAERGTQEELQQLKEDVIILQDQLEELSIGNANKMSISGYTDLEYHNYSDENKDPGFRLHHLSLFFEKRLNDEWKFFSEIEYEDAPFSEFEYTSNDTDSECSGCSGKVFVEAVNFTYSVKSELNIRGGRFFTPAGIWSVDHYPPFVPTQIRPNQVRRIFPQVIDGISTYGVVALSNTFLSYNFYLGNGEGNSGKEDVNSEKATGFKMAWILPFLQYFEIGGTLYNDSADSSLDQDVNDAIEVERQSVGAHLKLRMFNFTLQSEIANSKIDPDGADSYEREGQYLQLMYDIGSWTLGGRYDYYEDEANNSEITTNSLFVNYHVSESVVIKAEHHMEEDEDGENSNHSILSTVIYLGN